MAVSTDASTGRVFVLPGDTIDASILPSHSNNKPLRIGPGLRLVPPADVMPTVAGQLVRDRKKNSMWVEYNGGRYTPSQGDLVIGQVVRSTGDLYYVSLSAHASPATLPHEAFEGGGTRKTRPQLSHGQLVYARVALANRHMDAELECVTTSTGRADGLGPLLPPGSSATLTTTTTTTTTTTGIMGTAGGAGGGAGGAGTVFNVSLGLARRLLMARPRQDGGVAVLDLLAAEGLAFETAVGRNGRVWVASESVAAVSLVGRALRALDEGTLDVEAQRRLVKKLVQGVKAVRAGERGERGERKHAFHRWAIYLRVLRAISRYSARTHCFLDAGSGLAV